MPVQFTRRTRVQTRQLVGRLLTKLVETGAALATFSTSTIVLAEAKKRPDDYYIGKRVYIYEGTGVGEVAVCTDSVQATGTITISPVWTVTPTSTTKVEVWDESLTPERVNDLIDLAILQARDFFVFSRQNPTAISSDEKKLTLPTNMVKLARVYYEIDTGTDNDFEEYNRADSVQWLRQQQRGYAVAGDSVYVWPALPDGTLVADIWFEGYILPTIPTADSTTIDLPPGYVVYMAAFMAASGLIEGQELDPEAHSSQAAVWYRMAQDELRLRRTRVLPNTQDIAA